MLLDTQSSEVCLTAKEGRRDGRVSQSDWMIAVPAVIGSFEGAKNKQNQKSVFGPSSYPDAGPSTVAGHGTVSGSGTIIGPGTNIGPDSFFWPHSKTTY